MDLVFKLCCNTLYGDMTSKYFDAANVIVGNNVTARARAMVWYAEKGLHGIQSITDGGAFELNRVVYPIGKNRRVSGENVVDLYVCDDREARLQRQLKFAPLGDCDRIDLTWDDYCGVAINPENKRELAWDHVIPVCKNGPDAIYNLIPSCVNCNCRKSKINLLDWYPMQVFFDRQRLEFILENERLRALLFNGN